jgi:hypothetical protein
MNILCGVMNLSLWKFFQTNREIILIARSSNGVSPKPESPKTLKIHNSPISWKQFSKKRPSYSKLNCKHDIDIAWPWYLSMYCLFACLFFNYIHWVGLRKWISGIRPKFVSGIRPARSHPYSNTYLTVTLSFDWAALTLSPGCSASESHTHTYVCID